MRYKEKVRLAKEHCQTLNDPRLARIKQIDERRRAIKWSIWDIRAKIAQYKTSLMGLCLRMSAWETSNGFVLGVIGTFLSFNPWTWPLRLLVSALTEALNQFLQRQYIGPMVQQMALQAKAWADLLLQFDNQLSNLKSEFNSLSTERSGLATDVHGQVTESTQELGRFYADHQEDYKTLTTKCDPEQYGPDKIPSPDAEGAPPDVENPDVADPEQWFWQRLMDPSSTDSY